MSVSYWQDRVVLITGGSAGLGLAMGEAWAAAGAQVVLAARNPERLEQAAESIRQAGGRAERAPADITDLGQAAALIEQTVARFGRLDCLVNNAGISTRGAVLETSTEDFQKLWELNFLALARCTQLAAPHLIEAKGHLVNIGSLASKTASRYLGAYPASKFAVAAYSQQLRHELNPQGVHVLLVCPGPIARQDAGARYDQQAENLPEEARKPGGGVKLSGIPPQTLAEKILRACQRRRAELVLPGKAKLLFAISQLSPSWGDWILRKMT